MDNLRLLGVYENGFIGNPVNTIADHTNFRVVQDSSGLMYKINFNDKQIDQLNVNEKLNHLILDLVRSPSSIRNFEKRHDFLEEFLFTLPFTKKLINFKEFIKIQNQSPLFTDLHRRFIEDMFFYVLEGKRRTNIHAWKGIFAHIKPKPSLVPGSYSPEFTKMIDSHDFSYFTFNEFITKWITHPSGTGMDDLVNTAWIMYGSLKP